MRVVQAGDNRGARAAQLLEMGVIPRPPHFNISILRSTLAALWEKGLGETCLQLRREPCCNQELQSGRTTSVASARPRQSFTGHCCSVVQTFSAHHVSLLITSWISAFCCLSSRSRAMRVRWFIARSAKLLPRAGWWRELVPCGFACTTIHIRVACGAEGCPPTRVTYSIV